MGKAEAGTPKAMANRMKAKGLQKLKFYCQMCGKQCRDANGFKLHSASESHMRMMGIFADNPDHFLTAYSRDFLSEFIKLLSRRFGTRRVLANQVYNEYISDKEHLHMNSTNWATLTEFVKHLGKEGIAEVDETEKGWYIRWVDRRPETLARQEASLKQERLQKDQDSVESKALADQIRRAQALHNAAGAPGEPLPEDRALTRTGPEEEPLKLTLDVRKPGFLKPSVAPARLGALKKGNPLKSTGNPLKATGNPLKDSGNPFKGSSGSTLGSSSQGAPPSSRKISAVEEIMMQEMERKRVRDARPPPFPASRGSSGGTRDSRRDLDSRVPMDGDRSRDLGRDRARERDSERDRPRDRDSERDRSSGRDREPRMDDRESHRLARLDGSRREIRLDDQDPSRPSRSGDREVSRPVRSDDRDSSRPERPESPAGDRKRMDLPRESDRDSKRSRWE